MKKKLFSLLTALVLCLLCAVPAFAEMPLVMDTYELFKPEATAELEQKAQDASAGHGVNVYLLTVADIGGQNVREFAKDWYRNYDLGYGEGKSGILFLIALDSRDYVTITYGGGVPPLPTTASPRSRIRSCRCSRTDRITRPPTPT